MTWKCILVLTFVTVTIVAGAQSEEWMQCYNKIDYYTIRQVAAGASTFCRTLNNELSSYIDRSCSATAAASIKSGLLPDLQQSLNDVICTPTSTCSIRKKLTCNYEMYIRSEVGLIPPNVDSSMPTFLEKIGPGFSDGAGLSTYCSWSPNDAYYNGRTSCLRKADEYIYNNCLRSRNQAIKRNLTSLFNNAYLNLGPPAAPADAQQLRGEDGYMCQTPCAQTFSAAQTPTASCLNTFLNYYNGRSTPEWSQECKYFNTLNSCTQTAFAKCELAGAFYAPGVGAINASLPLCYGPWAVSDEEQCFNKLNFFSIKQVIRGPNDFCKALNNGDFRSYVDRTCSQAAATTMKNDYISNIETALSDVICSPTSTCSLKQKLTCNSLLYSQTAVGAIPSDVDSIMPQFLAGVALGLTNGNGMKTYCASSRTESWYADHVRCLQAADQNIYANCVPNGNNAGVTLLFNNAYLNLGPPAAPTSVEASKAGDQYMCTLSCKTNFLQGRAAIEACMNPFMANFQGTMYPPPPAMCSKVQTLGRCALQAFGQCKTTSAFYGPGINTIRNSFSYCFAGAAALQMSVSVLMLMFLVLAALL